MFNRVWHHISYDIAYMIETWSITPVMPLSWLSHEMVPITLIARAQSPLHALICALAQSPPIQSLSNIVRALFNDFKMTEASFQWTPRAIAHIVKGEHWHLLAALEQICPLPSYYGTYRRNIFDSYSLHDDIINTTILSLSARSRSAKQFMSAYRNLYEASPSFGAALANKTANETIIYLLKKVYGFTLKDYYYCADNTGPYLELMPVSTNEAALEFDLAFIFNCPPAELEGRFKRLVPAFDSDLNNIGDSESYLYDRRIIGLLSSYYFYSPAQRNMYLANNIANIIRLIDNTVFLETLLEFGHHNLYKYVITIVGHKRLREIRDPLLIEPFSLYHLNEMAPIDRDKTIKVFMGHGKEIIFLLASYYACLPVQDRDMNIWSALRSKVAKMRDRGSTDYFLRNKDSIQAHIDAGLISSREAYCRNSYTYYFVGTAEDLRAKDEIWRQFLRDNVRKLYFIGSMNVDMVKAMLKYTSLSAIAPNIMSRDEAVAFCAAL